MVNQLRKLFAKSVERPCSRLAKPKVSYNFQKVFITFKKHYKLVPLEVFGTNKYKALISTLLSSRTRDETTLKVSKKLFARANTIKQLDALSEREIVKLIYPVGFYKTKAKNIKKLTKEIITNHKGKIPSSREELMKLPGVGRKTANLVLNRAFGKPTIAVDTHVHRISNMLGWVKTKSPEKTEEALMKVIPKKYWNDTNRLFVSIGQQYRSKDNLKYFLKKEGLI